MAAAVFDLRESAIRIRTDTAPELTSAIIPEGHTVTSKWSVKVITGL